MSSTTVATTDKPKSQATIKGLLASDQMKAQIAAALPKHCTPERMIRAAITALTKNPKLATCTQESFFGALLSLSQWGLEPDGRNAHLIPYGRECTLILDYKGLVELCYRSGVVKSIHADIVRKGDLFEYSMGEVKQHTPWFLRQDAGRPDDAGDVFCAYCIVQLRDGATKTEVMSFEEIEGIRGRSKAGKSGPWVTDWNEMAKKTVFRRVSKWLPISAEIRDAFDKDGDRFPTIEGDFRPSRQESLSKTLDALEDHSEDGEPDSSQQEVESDKSMPQIIEQFEGWLAGCKSKKACQELLDSTLDCNQVDQPTEAYLNELMEKKIETLK